MKRFRFTLKKVGWALLTIALVVVLNFFLFRIMPGDPARAGMRDPRLSKENIEAIAARFGTDKPVIPCFESLNPVKAGSCLVNPLETQFFIYLKNLLHGELGVSFFTQEPVAEIIATRLTNTVILIFTAEVLAIVLGISLGTIASWKSNTPIDRGTLTVSLIFYSVPTFWFGMIMLILGSKLGLPLGGMVTAGMEHATLLKKWLDIGKHLLVPGFTYMIIVMGQYVIIMRSTLLDILSEDYILTAKAKGLNSFQILKDHAMKNAMLPMVTIIALNLGFAVAGAIQTESVFSYPGIGLAIYEAVSKRDYPLLQGSFLVIAISVVAANLIADLLYSYLDPRVEVG